MQNHHERPNRRIRSARWPNHLKRLISFLYSPERWSRANRVSWGADLERWRWTALLTVYHLAGVSTFSAEGRWTSIPFSEYRSPYSVTSEVEKLFPELPKELKRRGIRFAVIGNSLVSAWWSPLDRVLQELHAKLPHIAPLLVPIWKVLDEEVCAGKGWRVCSLCGRSFPPDRKARTCPPCRLRLPRWQRDRRLAMAPEDPVVLLAFPAREGGWRSRLYIRRGLEPPASLHRIAIPRNTNVKSA